MYSPAPIASSARARTSRRRRSGPSAPRRPAASRPRKARRSTRRATTSSPTPATGPTPTPSRPRSSKRCTRPATTTVIRPASHGNFRGETAMAKKTCFVVMGFGEKPDYATGRTLDLDKSFRIIIKKAVEEAGLECIRADNVVHSGVIDKPMYELLLNADVVVADLSTSNLNAVYELGVRHALRPHTTIILAESEFKFPFDLSHVVIRKYQHLGKGIDAEVAEALRDELRKAIEVLVAAPQVDSPVYTFLSHLVAWKPSAPPSQVPAASPTPTGTTSADERPSMLLEMFREARVRGDWLLAGEMLRRLLERNP